MSFLFPFLNFLQPGILWPELADYRPMLVASVICLAVGWARRSDFPRRDAFLNPIFLSLTAFVFVQALSVHFGGLNIMLNELLIWGMYWLFVLVSILLMSDAQALRRYVLGMILGGMVIVVYGICSVPFQLGLGGETGRAGAYGMYRNHNDYSFIIIQILPFIYTYMGTEKGALRTALRLSMVACVIGIFLSLSRGGVLALVLEFLLIVLLAMKGRRRFLLLPLVALLGVAAIGYQWAKRAENQQTGYTAETAEESREELWRAARKMIEARPLLGVGSRRFGEFARNYYDLSKNQIGKNSHDTYLEVLATSGLIGFGCFSFMLFGLWRQLRQRHDPRGPPWLEATRLGALISLYSMFFRALFDAKNDDWSFYSLVAIGIVYAALQRVSPANDVSALPAEIPQPSRGGRPRVYS